MAATEKSRELESRGPELLPGRNLCNGITEKQTVRGGGFCVGDGVGLWGFSQSAWLDFSAADRNDDRASTATPVLVALGAVEVMISY
jgi:hypothetical protein